MKGQLFLYIAATAVAAWGGITDLKCRKIYNKLTLPAAAAGIGLNGALAGIWGLKNSLLGLALGTSFMALWLMGTLKAGDVKLYMAVGALAGDDQTALAQTILVCHVHLVTMTMAFGHMGGAIELGDQRIFEQFRRIGAQTHRMAHVAIAGDDVLLLLHRGDDGIRALRVKL